MGIFGKFSICKCVGGALMANFNLAIQEFIKDLSKTLKLLISHTHSHKNV